MRNLPWDQAVYSAVRFLDMRRYFHYGDVWVPKNLKQGDVIRADLLTDHEGNGEPEVCPRNCLVLGMDLDMDTLELKQIRMVPFSYDINSINNDHELELDPRDPAMRFDVNGVRNSVVLRTGRMDVMPVDSAHFGFYLDRPGWIDPKLFPLIKKHLDLGFAAGRQCNPHRDNVTPDYEDTFFVPSLDYREWDNAFDWKLGENRKESYDGVDFFDLDEIGREAMADEMMENEAAKVYGRREQIQIEKGIRRTKFERQAQDEEAIRAVIRQFKKNNPEMSREERRNLIEASLAKLEDHDSQLADVSDDTIQIKDIPHLEEILSAQMVEAETHEEAKAEGLSRIFEQEIDPHSLKHLEDFGIGGLMREPTINLPDQLWRGRYVMMRIPNLKDPTEMAEYAYRPCVVWNAYARVNEYGEPELAGLELYPCTRSTAGSFDCKMWVRPLDTKVKKPSYLIADMMIRAPISAEYFQPDQPDASLFYNLLPAKVDEFDAKVRIVENLKGGPQIYGLQEVPDDWKAIDLPGPPDERTRKKLEKNGHARFMNITSMRENKRAFGNARKRNKGGSPKPQAPAA